MKYSILVQILLNLFLLSYINLNHDISHTKTKCNVARFELLTIVAYAIAVNIKIKINFSELKLIVIYVEN